VGADVSDISTRAQKVEKGWLLNGRKSMIANSRGFNVAVVTAYTEKEAGLGGLSFFVVPADNPGIKCCQHVETMGLRGALFGNILFENCLVPPDAIVGEPGAGFELYNELLTEGKIRCSAMAAGMAKRLLELSLKYAAEKKIKGKSIFRNQEYSFKIADMHTMIDTSVQLTRYAAWRYDKGENKSQTEVSVNCAKVFSSEAASKIAHMAMQIFGEHGYRDGSMVERIYRDSRFCELSMGGTESQRALIAGEVLKSYA
jgi:alkylation response protein AidB-like acyl-CoA dehydrogenase